MPVDATDCLASAYRLVAAAFLPPDGGAREAVFSEPTPMASGALAHALSRLRATFAAVTDGELRAEHARVFGQATSAGCPHSGALAEGRTLQKAQERAGADASSGGAGERLDLIATALEVAGRLAREEAPTGAAGNMERAAPTRDARRRFFEEDLRRWAPSFAKRLANRAGHGPYLAAARALEALLAADAEALGLAAVAAPLRSRPAGYA